MNIADISPKKNRVKYNWRAPTFKRVWEAHDFQLIKLEKKKSFYKFKLYWYSCGHKNCSKGLS